MKILLLGKNGQVGRELERALAPVGQLHAVGRETLDMAHLDRIRLLLLASRPDIIVNAAAYTAVDQAETEPDLVKLVNSDAVEVLAAGAVELGALLVHFSTDYVFDGWLDRPYREDDATGPLNVYGRSKLAAEQNIERSGADSLIFRASWIYGGRDKNFPTSILNQARTKTALNVVADSIGAPTDARLIADVTAIALRRHKEGGTWRGLSSYHLTAGGETSWFDYARFIIKCAREQGEELALTESDIFPIQQQDLNSSAMRPKNSCLDTTKIRRALDIDLPDWEVGVAGFIESLGKRKVYET